MEEPAKPRLRWKMAVKVVRSRTCGKLLSLIFYVNRQMQIIYIIYMQVWFSFQTVDNVWDLGVGSLVITVKC